MHIQALIKQEVDFISAWLSYDYLNMSMEGVLSAYEKQADKKIRMKSMAIA